jgi:hypothetical protein
MFLALTLLAAILFSAGSIDPHRPQSSCGRSTLTPFDARLPTFRLSNHKVGPLLNFIPVLKTVSAVRYCVCALW